jgi:hypothetical protein
MAVTNLADPKVRAEAIASGLVWSGPAGAQEAACKDIASGRVPMPSYPLPAQAMARIHELNGAPTFDDPTDEGGPA